MAALRVVLDTDVLLSGIAYPASVPGKILTAWRHASIEVLLSDYILDELRRVLPRLAHRHGLTVAEMSDLVEVTTTAGCRASIGAILNEVKNCYPDGS